MTLDWNLSDVFESILVIIIIEVQIASPWPVGDFLSVLLNPFDLTLQDFDSFPARRPRLILWNPCPRPLIKHFSKDS